jgi:hypothetical protein
MTTMRITNTDPAGILLALVLTMTALGQVDTKTQLYRNDAKGDYQYQRKEHHGRNRSGPSSSIRPK